MSVSEQSVANPNLAATSARPTDHDMSTLRTALAAIVFAFALGLLWMIMHDYQGLRHDGQLYTFQALAHLHPGSLANDIYLRYGSQDDFTLFSPLYAGVIRLLGVEHAAALLTFLFQVAFVLCAWLLARKLLPPRLVLLGIAFLIVIRGDYGTYHVFRSIEDFITPRMAAEALVLAGLTAMSARRPMWTWIFLVSAALLHPLMAAAGVAFVLCVQVAMPRPRFAAAVCLAAGGVLIALGFAPFTANLRFDPPWLELLQRKAYLFVTLWEPKEWGRIAIPLTTLGMGAIALEPSQARTFCRAALLVSAGGILLTLIGGDLLRLAPITQSQPWRFLWIATVLSTLLLPLIVGCCWQSGSTGRAAALLLIAMWVLRGEVYPLEIAPLVLLGAWAVSAKYDAPPTLQKWLVPCAWLVLALSVVWTEAVLWLFAKGLPFQFDTRLLLLQARTWCREGSIPALLITGTWWICWKGGPRALLYPVGAAAAGAFLTVLPLSVGEWTWRSYPPAVYAVYAPWRALIPSGAEVFWAKGDPIPAWLLLDRPSYMTVQQTGSNLFSRRAGMELERRLEVLRNAFNMGTREREVPTLAALCARSDLKFLVTSYDLQARALAEAPAGAPKDFQALRLYRCDRP
jgi:hypothetical protein